MKIQHQTGQAAYSSGGFIGKYQKLVSETVIPYQYTVLNDKAEGAEKSHVVRNFINAGRAVRGEDTGDGFYGMVFQDSDAAKWIEAAAYSLRNFPDPVLEKQVDDLIDIIAAAQDEDGYLDTYFTIKDKEKRWTNLLEAHELYCAGHMIEAACACCEALGKRKLLDVMLKNVSHIYKVFVEDKHGGFPGHPEIELALMKMYRLTGDRKCLELAEYFINTRGCDTDYYKRECEARKWQVWGNDPGNGDYQQSAVPLRKASDAVGHAVRAVYLYTGMADLAAETGDSELYDACVRLWNSITKRQMYVTGGIGSTVHGEAFSTDFDLPPDTAYAETCASIGLMFFASRMLENEVKGEYADVMEQAFYNTVLASMQLDGKRFFYVNPLEVVPGISGKVQTQKHDLTQRPGWYACACCPPNAARLISSFGKYAYGESADTAYCHLFAAGSVSFEKGIQLSCETEYPYDFTVKYKVSGNGNVAVRIPAWSKQFTLTVNGSPVNAEPANGYVYLPVAGSSEIVLTLDDTPRFVYASPKIPRLTGFAAVCRGPLVYCFEGVDNGGDVLSLRLDTSGNITVSDEPETLGGTVKLGVPALRTAQTDELYTSQRPAQTACTAYAVPYCTWGNRGENQMRVWIPTAK